jgi:hypothetical protein
MDREMLDTIVTLRVGATNKKTHLQIHKGLLCKASPYFRAALERGFKEAETQIIEWPEEELETVRIFQLWLYYGPWVLAWGTAFQRGRS